MDSFTFDQNVGLDVYPSEFIQTTVQNGLAGVRFFFNRNTISPNEFHLSTRNRFRVLELKTCFQVPMWAIWSFILCAVLIMAVLLLDYCVIRRNALGNTCCSKARQKRGGTNAAHQKRSTNMLLNVWKIDHFLKIRKKHCVFFDLSCKIFCRNLTATPHKLIRMFKLLIESKIKTWSWEHVHYLSHMFFSYQFHHLWGT